MGKNSSKPLQQTDPTENTQLIEQSGSCKFYKNKAGTEFEKYRVEGERGSDFQNKYEFRIRNPSPYLVTAYYAKPVSNALGCNSKDSYEVVTQRIYRRLSEIGNLSAGQSLNAIYRALRGYQQIYKSSGMLLVLQTMIGLDKESKIKVWLNSNFALNQKESKPLSYSMLPQFQQESQLVDNIIQLINSRTVRDRAWNDFLQQKYSYGKIGFKEAIQLIERHGTKNNVVLEGSLGEKPDFEYWESSHPKSKLTLHHQLPQHNHQNFEGKKKNSRILQVTQIINKKQLNNQQIYTPLTKVGQSNYSSSQHHWDNHNRNLNVQRNNVQLSRYPLNQNNKFARPQRIQEGNPPNISSIRQRITGQNSRKQTDNNFQGISHQQKIYSTQNRSYSLPGSIKNPQHQHQHQYQYQQPHLQSQQSTQNQFGFNQQNYNTSTLQFNNVQHGPNNRRQISRQPVRNNNNQKTDLRFRSQSIQNLNYAPGKPIVNFGGMTVFQRPNGSSQNMVNRTSIPKQIMQNNQTSYETTKIERNMNTIGENNRISSQEKQQQRINQEPKLQNYEKITENDVLAVTDRQYQKLYEEEEKQRERQRQRERERQRDKQRERQIQREQRQRQIQSEKQRQQEQERDNIKEIISQVTYLNNTDNPTQNMPNQTIWQRSEEKREYQMANSIHTNQNQFVEKQNSITEKSMASKSNSHSMVNQQYQINQSVTSQIIQSNQSKQSKQHKQYSHQYKQQRISDQGYKSVQESKRNVQNNRIEGSKISVKSSADLKGMVSYKDLREILKNTRRKN